MAFVVLHIKKHTTPSLNFLGACNGSNVELHTHENVASWPQGLKLKFIFLVELHFKRCKSFCKLFKALKAFFIKVLKLAGTSFVPLFQLRQAIGILKKTCLRRPIEILYFLPGRFSKCLTLLFVFSIRGHMQAEACIYKQGIFIHVFPIRIIVPWL